MSAAYEFLPWVREGLATAVADGDGATPALPARATASVRLDINDRQIETKLTVYGPGDVREIDTDQIVRVHPAPDTASFEPNLFPLIEFDRPDFPWLFTPARADAEDRLRPWLVLVVVREQDGVTLESSRGGLPRLEIDDPARPADELPDLSESWAWAHAQVVADAGEDLGGLLAARSERNLSRLLCPRRLAPDSGYLACLVPAFEQGRLAGLGQPSSDLQTLAPAWGFGAQAPKSITLPVYHHWRFRTGARGDFEALVRRLRPRPLPETVGTRAMSVTDLGYGLPDLGVIRQGGALRAPGTRLGIVPDGFREPLLELLNLAESRRTAGNDEDVDPLIGPPIYGRFQARVDAVPDHGGEPRWLRDANLNPRYRVAAGLGASVVQELQEELMASAWQQLADIEAVNQLRVQAELAVEVGRRVHEKHLQPLSPGRVQLMASPAGARLRLTSVTLERTLKTMGVTSAASSSAIRRAARPRGPVMRRFGLGAPKTGDGQDSQFFMRLAGGIIRDDQFFEIDGKVGPNDVADAMVRMHAATQSRIFDPRRNLARSLYDSAKRMETYVFEANRLWSATLRQWDPIGTETTFGKIRGTLLDQLDPANTVSARVARRVAGDDGTTVPAEDAADPAAPMPHPQFPQPMYRQLIRRAPDYLLPGLAAVPANTVTLAQTDPRFITAFMVGLNHEMSRELLWRRFPTDQRGTYFRTFWDSRGLPHAPTHQMDPIHLWDPGAPLGEALLGARGPGRTVLVIRGEILQRYPGASIYAARPAAAATDWAETRHPIFRGDIPPDIALLGFDMPIAEILDEGDWYFVIQQPPTDASFGFDVATTFGGPAVTDWNNLSWGHLVETAEQLEALTHVSLQGRLTGNSAGGLQWGRNAAHMAAIALQRPARIAIKANLILPTEVEPR